MSGEWKGSFYSKWRGQLWFSQIKVFQYRRGSCHTAETNYSWSNPLTVWCNLWCNTSQLSCSQLTSCTVSVRKNISNKVISLMDRRTVWCTLRLLTQMVRPRSASRFFFFHRMYHIAVFLCSHHDWSCELHPQAPRASRSSSLSQPLLKLLFVHLAGWVCYYRLHASVVRATWLAHSWQ